MCAYALELFVITDGLPIAEYSEQSIESWNKFIRAYKSGPAAKARQMLTKMNTQDIFHKVTEPLLYPAMNKGMIDW